MFRNNSIRYGKVEAAKHLAVLEKHGEDWQPSDQVSYLKLLERFDVFGEAANPKEYRPRLPTPAETGTGRTWALSRPGAGGKGR